VKYFIRSIRTGLAPLIVAVAMTIGVGAPLLANAADAIQNANDARKIGQANDLKLKARDPMYVEQAKSQAEKYRATAAIVAGQGGNAQPLLDAAAQLESQSELIMKAQQAPLSVQFPETAVGSTTRNTAPAQ
jgi:hypothetical protein